MIVRARSVLLILFASLIGAVPALSQDVGDTVKATRSIELKVEEEVVASVETGDTLKVRKTSGKWLWVQTADGQRGWVLKDFVRSGDAAAADEAPPAPAATKPAQAAASSDPWLTTVGVLAGQNIYTTYAYIGAVADGYGGKSYTARQVQDLMAEVVAMANVTRQHLQQVQQTGLVEQDRAAIDEVLSILALLSDEATALSNYAKSGSDVDLQAYGKARMEALPKVKKMLDLK